jgi:hypothetical protein
VREDPAREIRLRVFLGLVGVVVARPAEEGHRRSMTARLATLGLRGSLDCCQELARPPTRA